MSVNHCWVSTLQSYARWYRGVNACRRAGSIWSDPCKCTHQHGSVSVFTFGDTLTVAEWTKKRFKQKYPGYDVQVLDAEGNKVVGNSTLETIRNTYVED